MNDFFDSNIYGAIVIFMTMVSIVCGYLFINSI